MTHLTARQWLSVLGLALGVRVLVAFGLAMPLVSDALSYSEAALDLASHFPGSKAHFWPPGMPLVLACAYQLFGAGIAVSRIAVIFFGVAHVALLGLVAARLGLQPRTWFAVGVLAALYPASVMMSGQTYSQHLAALCVMGFAHATLRSLQERSMASGLGAALWLALGILTRPSMLSVMALAMLAYLVAFARDPGRRFYLANAISLFVVATLASAPFVIHNAGMGAGYTLSTNNERNLFLGNTPFTPLYKTSHLAQRERSTDELSQETLDYLGRFEGTDPDSRARMSRETLRQIAGEPGAFLLRTANRTRAFWGFDYLMSRRIELYFELGSIGLCMLLALEAGAYLLIVVSAIVAISSRLVAREGVLLILAIVASYQLPYCLAFSSGTYHFPVIGLLTVLAGPGLLSMIERPRDVINRRVLGLVVLFGLIQLEYAYFTWVHI